MVVTLASCNLNIALVCLEDQTVDEEGQAALLQPECAHFSAILLKVNGQKIVVWYQVVYVLG